MEVGKTVGTRVHGALLNTLVRLAGQLGVGPWLAVRQAYKLWVRSFRGGAIAAYRLGERTAQLEVTQSVISQSRFFRASFAGVTFAGMEPLCVGLKVQERPAARTKTSFVLRITWDE